MLPAAIDPVLYELKNNFVSSFAFVAFAIVTYFVVAEHYQAFKSFREEHLPFMRSFREAFAFNYKLVRIQLAYAFAGFLFGEYVTSFWTFLIRYLDDVDKSYTWWMSTVPFIFTPVIGGGIQIVSSICLVRILCPEEWGHGGWIVATLYALLWSSILIFWQ